MKRGLGRPRGAPAAMEVRANSCVQARSAARSAKALRPNSPHLTAITPCGSDLAPLYPVCL